MSLYMGIIRQSFIGDNVLTVVSKILKIVRNSFKLLWLEELLIFKTTLELIYENYQQITVNPFPPWYIIGTSFGITGPYLLQ